MRPRVPTILLAVTGLLVAVAVGLVANAIASRSFTPGVDALPSAGSLAPPLVRTAEVPAGAAEGVKTTAATPVPAAKPKPAAKPEASQATTSQKVTAAKTTTAKATTTAAPAPATTDDHGGSGKGKGSGTSGSGSGSSGSGKHGSDD